jgi:hypothetical protein
MLVVVVDIKEETEEEDSFHAVVGLAVYALIKLMMLGSS